MSDSWSPLYFVPTHQGLNLWQSDLSLTEPSDAVSYRPGRTTTENVFPDTRSFFVSNPLGSPKLKLDERFALYSLVDRPSRRGIFRLAGNEFAVVDERSLRCLRKNATI